MDLKPANNSVFEIFWPARKHRGVIFSSPHSGRHYPAAFLAASQLDSHKIRQSEDCFVDDLFAGMPDLGAVLLKANFPRAFIDVNRQAYELDPEMFEDELPAHVNKTSIRVASGLGTIPKLVSTNNPIYKDRLKFADATQRINDYYFPYHQALTELIELQTAEHGKALLIDCHSMPSKTTMVRFMHSKRPDIILGDRFGGSCSVDLRNNLQQAFTAHGLSVACNKPYAGGFITQNYGRPFNNIHAIQVEINRGLYMDEKRLEKTKDFAALKQTLEKVFAAFFETGNLTIMPRTMAAE